MEQTQNCIINISNRENLTLGGVIDVDNFDEACITVVTELGTLCLKGADFHINRLNVETGELNISGSFDSLAYINNAKVRGESIFARIFK